MKQLKIKSTSYLFPLTVGLVCCLLAYGTSLTHEKISREVPASFFQDTVKIKRADKFTQKTEADGTNLSILEGNVELQQGKTIFKSDRAVKNDRLNTFEAWGHVHINDADTTDIYADHLKYFGNTQIANLNGNVKLTDRQAVLTAPSLEYNMNTNIGTYKNGGKVVNKKTVITSREGLYYSDIKDVYFKRNVIVNDPGYHITTDSLLYNTGLQTARFISQTHIKDSTKNTIDTKEGFYNLKTGEAQFGQNPVLVNAAKRTSLTALNVSLDNNIAKAEGNAVVVDSIRGSIVIANLIFQNRLNEAVLATQKPVMIIRQDKDSIYVAADTLFSAKLSDLFETRESHGVDTTVNKDSLSIKAQASRKSSDSTDRYFEAFHHVKIYSDSMQAVSDSLFYSFRDSTFRLFQNPAVWGKESQVTGDTILLHTKNKAPHWMEVYKNSFMVSHLQQEAYNQIKSSRMDAYFINGGLDSVRAKGSAESIYYVQDKDSAFSNINQSTSDIIDIYFRKKKMYKVAMRSNVNGVIYPIQQRSPGEMRLEGFKWLEALRPKTKYDLFE